MKQRTLWQHFGMFFYKRRSLTALLFAGLSIFGVISYTTLMRREGFPPINLPIASVQVVSFGGDAASVDTSFTVPIVDAVKQQPAVKEVTASSTDQGAGVFIVYKDGTDVARQLTELESTLGPRLPSSGRVLYLPIDAGKWTAQGDDLLISVYGETDDKTLDSSAATLAAEIKSKSPLTREVHTYPSFESATNSAGAATAEQVRFDRYYSNDTSKQYRSSLIGVAGVAGVDQLKLYDEVAAIADSRSESGIRAHISTSFAEGIREQVSSLQRNLLEGLAVVLVVSFVLISLRSSIATALSMTATILITVGVLQLIGYSLNTITLFSLVLCLALIVDDTTIMVEAIDAGLASGKRFRDVVEESMRKVARASATGTITTMLAFAPMLFISGILGKFIKAIPVTIIISLAVSLIVSFVFIPLIVRLTYGRVVRYKARRFDVADHLEKKIAGSLASALEWSDGNRRRRFSMRAAAVAVGVAFLLAGGAIFSKVGFNIFPTPKDGTELAVQAQVVDRERATLNSTIQLTDTSLSVVRQELGGNLEHYTLGGGQSEAGRDGFSATLGLSPLGSRNETAVQLATRLQTALTRAVPELRFTVRTIGAGPPQSGFAVDISADDSAKAYALASDLRSYMDGLELKRLDGTAAQLKDVTVTPSVIIKRTLSGRVVTVSADYSADDTSTLVSLAQDAVNKEFSAERLQSQYGLSGDQLRFNIGQEQDNQDSFSSMSKAAGPLFVVMIVAMALLFRSLLQSLLILTALPFAIFGVANGLYWSNNEISFFTMLGVFALIGISLNNTILLTDYANQAKARGKKSVAAMAEALRARFRPLLTTSVTSVLALLPLALNDPFWEGLAFALMFGLVSSTILVVIVFPYFYLIDESIGELFHRLRKRVVKTKRRTS